MPGPTDALAPPPWAMNHHISVTLKSVPKPVKRLQPLSYHAFRCIGAVCEDSCCIGWTVHVDKLTYEAYQQCNDPELGPQLCELVTIAAASTHGDDHARITVSGATCPFLSEGLCAIQKKLGAHQLSVMCATYPRVMNVVDDVLRSLPLCDHSLFCLLQCDQPIAVPLRHEKCS
jgi:hypothetical protein